jgi:hypothetical protein
VVLVRLFWLSQSKSDCFCSQIAPPKIVEQAEKLGVYRSSMGAAAQERLDGYSTLL